MRHRRDAGIILAMENTALAYQTLAEKCQSLEAEIIALRNRVRWFEKQLFGQKSEKRLVDNPYQCPLALSESPVATPPEGEKQTITYQRGTAKKQRPDACVNDAGLRFTDDVPVEVIKTMPAELCGPDADQYDIIATKIVYRLAQRSASYVVLQYERPVIKRKDQTAPEPCPTPANVLERSIADVSLLVGLLIDKFHYHLPLYRQHQRLQQAGITLSRATLTNLSKRAIELLRPIVQAQLDNILRSKVLAMDETPIKAGKSGKGKMKQGWFWPLYGDRHEVVFTYSASRARQHIEQTLQKQFNGTLLSDGYAAYARYAQQCEGVTHAQCWTHTRRQFIEAEHDEPEAVAHALALIRQLYQCETDIVEKGLAGEQKREYRLAHSKAVVDRLYTWCEAQLQRNDLTPRQPLTRALKYTLSREQALRVFLEDPEVPLDTNHLERALRPIPMGRKNWLFCWTEIGAEHVGIIQSLISTCKLHNINTHTYLTDVLLRISEHPARQVHELTPRIWKDIFADKPLRSDLEKLVDGR
jgi:transposase